jgi:hypothetical protein
MNKLTFMFLLVLISALLLLSACGDDDNDGITGIPNITPDSYDWDIYFMDFSEFDEKSTEYVIWADWLGDAAAISESDMFTIKIGANTYDFGGENYYGEWSFHTMADLEPGTQYSMEFFKNGNSLASATLRMPYPANTTFPTSFDPTQSASMSWDMAGNNQYQIAGLSSWDYETDEEDDFEKSLSPSAREYTFAANTVQGFGMDTEYYMMLVQANFSKSGRYAFSSTAVSATGYGEEYSAQLEPSEMHKLVKRVHSQM